MTGPQVTNAFDALTFTYALVGTGDTHLKFSDNSDYSYGGPLASYDPAGNSCWRHNLRTSPTTSIEGPVIVPADFHAWYDQNGWEWDPRLDVNPPIAKLTPPVVVTVSSDPTPVVTATNFVPVSAGPAALVAHVGTVHESLIQSLESHAAGWGRAAEADIKALCAKLRDVFAAAKAKL